MKKETVFNVSKSYKYVNTNVSVVGKDKAGVTPAVTKEQNQPPCVSLPQP